MSLSRRAWDVGYDLPWPSVLHGTPLSWMTGEG